VKRERSGGLTRTAAVLDAASVGCLASAAAHLPELPAATTLLIHRR
jgi:hypothetical protein